MLLVDSAIWYVFMSWFNICTTLSQANIYFYEDSNQKLRVDSNQ